MNLQPNEVDYYKQSLYQRIHFRDRKFEIYGALKSSKLSVFEGFRRNFYTFIDKSAYSSIRLYGYRNIFHVIFSDLFKIILKVVPSLITDCLTKILPLW
jgi:hypothetical protein